MYLVALPAYEPYDFTPIATLPLKVRENQHTLPHWLGVIWPVSEILGIWTAERIPPI